MSEREETEPYFLDILPELVENHPPPPTDECDDQECEICSYRDCPHHDVMHYHHDGCPSCYACTCDLHAKK